MIVLPVTDKFLPIRNVYICISTLFYGGVSSINTYKWKVKEIVKPHIYDINIMIDRFTSKIDVIGLFQACVLRDNCVELTIRTSRSIYSFSYAKETCALSMNKSLFMWYTEILLNQTGLWTWHNLQQITFVSIAIMTWLPDQGSRTFLLLVNSDFWMQCSIKP
jgi:hypothetical protein